MRQIIVAVAVVAMGVGSAACASKKYVNTRVTEVNDKVTTLSKSVEETQERTRRNEQKITEVDQKASAASDRAGAAGVAADRANTAVAATDAKVETMDKTSRRLVYEVVISDDKNRFAFGKAELADDVKAQLDDLFRQLTTDPKNVYLEIEGHTDAVGSANNNERLGLERAEAVKRYLYEQHNVPLHKMSVISYGETKPIAPNNTREGRAKNRRVVIKVLA